MKYFYLFLIILPVGLHAQIVVGSGAMPLANDTLRYSLANTADSVDYTTTGAGITWDFSDLSFQGQGLLEYKYAAAVNIAYAFLFGPTAYGEKIADTLDLIAVQLVDMYSFYENTSGAFRALGLGFEYSGLPIPLEYSDKDEVYTLPLNYGDYDSTTFYGRVALSTSFTYAIEGARVNRVDGWGTIITPFATRSVLRVKSTVYRTDSILISGIPFPIAIPSTEISYKWLSATDRMPLLEITGRTGFGGGFNVTRVRYRDMYRTGVGMHEEQVSSLGIFPNPTGNIINIGNKLQSLARLQVFNSQGQEVMLLEWQPGQPISLSSLPAGMYQVVLMEYASGKRYSGTCIKQ